MMSNIPSLTRRFEHVFNKKQASVLAESITEAYTNLVNTSDFNELKSIVKDLAEAQLRTETRMEELAQAQQRTETRMGELSQAQQRTETRMGELSQAQRRTETRMEELAQAQQRTETRMGELAINMSQLTQVVTGLGQEMGGLSRTMSYALENEAYRALPAYLERRFDVAIRTRVIRTEIEGEEIDFLAHGEKDGRSICFIGESKLRIDGRRHGGQELDRIIDQLDRKVEAVKKAYPDCEIIRFLVTHYARPFVLERLEAANILVVQSFDWGNGRNR